MQKLKGFTLIELLIVIAIIGVLSSIIIVSLSSARDSAKAAKSVAEIKALRTGVIAYFADTGQLPVGCGLNCTSTSDPFLNALGVPRWGGPYLPLPNGLWNLSHGWGGHMTVDVADINMNGTPDLYIFLDEDAPGTNANNNTGLIPLFGLQKIDETIDDGNLSTGNARGDGQGYLTVTGEMVVKISP